MGVLNLVPVGSGRGSAALHASQIATTGSNLVPGYHVLAIVCSQCRHGSGGNMWDHSASCSNVSLAASAQCGGRSFELWARATRSATLHY